MTMEEMQHEIDALRRVVNGLISRLPRTTGRTVGTGHDHSELRGRRVADTAPSDGQVLKFSTTAKQWEPAAAGAGGGTSHVILNDGATIGLQRANLDFRQGVIATDNISTNSSRINLDFALAAALKADAATASAGTANTVTRGDHVHPGAYTDAKARAAVKFTIYVPLGNSVLGQTATPTGL